MRLFVTHYIFISIFQFILITNIEKRIHEFFKFLIKQSLIDERPDLRHKFQRYYNIMMILYYAMMTPLDIMIIYLFKHDIGSSISNISNQSNINILTSIILSILIILMLLKFFVILIAWLATFLPFINNLINDVISSKIRSKDNHSRLVDIVYNYFSKKSKSYLIK